MTRCKQRPQCLFCRTRVQIVRLNGETLSGFGGERVMRIMLERVIGDLDRYAA